VMSKCRGLLVAQGGKCPSDYTRVPASHRAFIGDCCVPTIAIKSGLYPELLRLATIGARIDNALRQVQKNLTTVIKANKTSRLGGGGTKSKSSPRQIAVKKRANKFALKLTEYERQMQWLQKQIAAAKTVEEKKLLIEQLAILSEKMTTFSEQLKSFLSRGNVRIIVGTTAATVIALVSGRLLKDGVIPTIHAARYFVGDLLQGIVYALNALKRVIDAATVHVQWQTIKNIISTGFEIAKKLLTSFSPF